MNIFEAILAGDVAAVGRAVRANPKCISARDERGWSPLHLVAALGVDTKPIHLKIVEILVAKGTDVNARTSLGWTPIHIIALHGTKESLGVAQYLINHGADLSARDKFGADWKVVWRHGQEIWNLLCVGKVKKPRTQLNRLGRRNPG